MTDPHFVNYLTSFSYRNPFITDLFQQDVPLPSHAWIHTLLHNSVHPFTGTFSQLVFHHKMFIRERYTQWNYCCSRNSLSYKTTFIGLHIKWLSYLFYYLTLYISNTVMPSGHHCTNANQFFNQIVADANSIDGMVNGVSWPSGLVHRILVLMVSECGFESRHCRSWSLCPWARHLTIIASSFGWDVKL